ncbi:16585_t:CDS:2 [Funneliformis caledonium]|uniref:16585_t:CDS:1 n=1 Tax=Funneliformis caledonium TaxID=1117310 RepID=A0A9N8ZRH7_9GLOM|nr:16585_t:CDS:2 [Funneliformis caledonium]
MYLPNAGCEIAETPRYSGSDKREACIIATKKWQAGDEIRFCTGVLVPITSEEERALEGGRDFSIMWSTRKDCMCLLLGPARFVNHDCNPNTHFIATGQNTISFKLLRDVAVGEELTAHYGENYFGQGNEECLCVTCEQKQTGGFKKVRDDTEEDTAYEGLRPFVYNDGRLVRRSTRRNKSIHFNNTSKNKCKPAPARVNIKNMEITDDDDLVESSSLADAYSKRNKGGFVRNLNQVNKKLQSTSDTNFAQQTESSSPTSMDIDTTADDHVTSMRTRTNVYDRIPLVCERPASTSMQPTVNTNVPGRTTSIRIDGRNGRPVNSSSNMRKRTFLEPMSFRAMFSATRMRPNTSFEAMMNPPSRTTQNVTYTSDQSRINLSSTTIIQGNNFQPPKISNKSNTVFQESRGGSSTSISSSQRSSNKPEMLLHTSLTNSGAKQEITTGLSIQSNAMSEQSSRTASNFVPNISRGINPILSRFPRSSNDNGKSFTNTDASNNISNPVINLRESELLHTTGTKEQISSIAPVTANHGEDTTTSRYNQSRNLGFSRQYIAPSVSEITGFTKPRPINLLDPESGVMLTANPKLRISWGIETTRQFIIPENKATWRGLANAYNGTENRSRVSNSNTSRMSIAYLCSDDLSCQNGILTSSRNENSQKLPSNFNDKHNVKRYCRVCHEKFAPLPTDITSYKCPRCSRHFSLYNLEWPLRKQPKEKGKAKEIKNRGDTANRREKKATSLATMTMITNNNKGKAKVVVPATPAIHVVDKKEHNERMQAIIFAESNVEWLPLPGIDKEKFEVGEEQPTAGRAFSVSMKRKKNEKPTISEVWYKPFLRWSTSTGYVHLNSVWRYIENHTSDNNNINLRAVKKKVCKTSQSDFEENDFRAASLQGGYATYQGDWVPYEDAQKIVEELGHSELLRKFILPPSGNVTATPSVPLEVVTFKRSYEDVDAEDSDVEPSQKNLLRNSKWLVSKPKDTIVPSQQHSLLAVDYLAEKK